MSTRPSQFLKIGPKDEFDTLRSTLEEQISSVYQLAEYAEKIRVGADQTF
jgi:hypothetical protein